MTILLDLILKSIFENIKIMSVPSCHYERKGSELSFEDSKKEVVHR